MFQIAIIYFREFLEISLIVGIILSATKTIKNRSPYIISGILGGIVISLLFAGLLSYLSGKINSDVEDLVALVALIINIILIAYTVIWMKSHSSTAMLNFKGKANIPLFTITSVILASVTREGVEIVLFTYGNIIASGITVPNLFIGALIGTSLGVLAGFITYLGIVKLPIKYFFKATTTLLTLLAASFASEIPLYLESMDLFNINSIPLWDSSNFINEQSIIGKVLHSVIGYTDRPSALQVIFYISIIFFIKLGSIYTQNKSEN